MTSRWVFGLHDGVIPEDAMDLPEHREIVGAFAIEDMVDVEQAELLLAFTEPRAAFVGRGGRHVEMGLALAWRKYVWIVGPMENIFYTLGHVQQFADFAEVLMVLDHKRVTRCTGCDGMTHHWLPKSNPPLYDYMCQHCSVVGRSCKPCGGDDADEDCSVCHGEGVVRVGGLRVVDSDEDC